MDYAEWFNHSFAHSLATISKPSDRKKIHRLQLQLTVLLEPWQFEYGKIYMPKAKNPYCISCFLVSRVVRRDRHEIVVDILNEAIGGKKKTELMSEVGLSFAQMKLYLDKLVEKGLLESNETHHIKTTKTGVEFLKKCGECLLFPWEKQE